MVNPNYIHLRGPFINAIDHTMRVVNKGSVRQFEPWRFWNEWESAGKLCQGSDVLLKR